MCLVHYPIKIHSHSSFSSPPQPVSPTPSLRPHAPAPSSVFFLMDSDID